MLGAHLADNTYMTTYVDPASITFITALDPVRAEYVHETADFVLHEVENTKYPVQWVIVEDGPHSSWRPIADDIWSKLDAVWDCQGAHAGVAAARTRGLAHATGDLVFAMDGDDVVSPGMTDMIIDAFKANPDAVAVAGVNSGIIGKPTPVQSIHVIKEGMERRFEVDELPRSWISPFPFHPGLVVYRKDVLLRLNGWPALAGGDDRALVFAANAFGPVITTKIPVLSHRMWKNQIMSHDFYVTNRPVYQRLSWLFSDARLRHSTGEGLAGEPPSLPL